MNFARSFIVLTVAAASVSSYASGCGNSGTYPSPIMGTGTAEAGAAFDSGDDSTADGTTTSLSNGGGGGGGTGATDMQCEAMTSQECLNCCAENHEESYAAFQTAMLACACGGDAGTGVCAQPCAASFCAQKTPTAGDACATCLAESVQQDAGGQCLPALAAACPQGGPCDAYFTCADYCP